MIKEIVELRSENYKNMRISAIIPTYKENANIAYLVRMLFDHRRDGLSEVIVVDHQSSEESLQAAVQEGAKVLLSSRKGRAWQMNYGASVATGDIFYFVHTDIKIHPDYAIDIPVAIANGYDLGCYRFIFDSNKWLLKINSWFTRLPFIWCRGGDQTLFVKKEVFNALGGYKDYQIMEDYDFIKRAQKNYRFGIIPKSVIVSARKYQVNSYLRVQWTNYTIMRMWQNGASQEAMLKKYKKMLNH